MGSDGGSHYYGQPAVFTEASVYSTTYPSFYPDILKPADRPRPLGWLTARARAKARRRGEKR